MILRHSRTPSQVTPASVSLSHPPLVTDTGQLPAYLSWARRLVSMVPGSIHAAIPPRSLRAEPEMFRRTSATIAALNARAFWLG